MLREVNPPHKASLRLGLALFGDEVGRLLKQPAEQAWAAPVSAPATAKK